MSQIDYTSRDYDALKTDIINLINSRTGLNWKPTDPSDIGGVLVDAFAYMGDIMSHYLDRVANETSVETAIRRDTLINFANLYGYKPSGPTPATVDVIFTNISSNTVDLPAGTQVMAPLSYGPFSEAYFETTDSKSAILPGQVITIPCIEGKTVNTDRPDLIDPTYHKPIPTNIGTSTGLANQNVLIPFDTGIIDGSLIVYIGQGPAFAPWKYVDSLLEQTPEALVFTTVQNTDGTLNIVFGDNINGAIPPAGQLISAIYKTSVGATGNVVANAISELTFIPGNNSPEAVSYFTVTNPAPAVGGADQDNLTQIKNKIKAATTTRRRAITLNDYENLALLVPRVGKAKAVAAYYSSVTLYVQSQNDPSSLTPGVALNRQSITAIAASTPSVGYATYTTSADHGYAANDVVTISGVTPSGYNANNAIVTSVPATNQFVIANATTTTYTSGGYVIDPKPLSTWISLASEVKNYLQDKVPVGTTVTVLPPVYTPLYLGVTVNIDAAHSQNATKQQIYAALMGADGLYAYDNNAFGKTVYVSQIMGAIQGIPGVQSVSITALNTDNLGGAGNIALKPYQIPYLTVENTSITVIGGV